MLQEPLTAAVHVGIASHCSQYALDVHDRSHLNYQHLYSARSQLRILKSVQRLILQGINVFQFSASVTARSINKTDTYATTHAMDVGYDLQTSLIVSDQKGNRSHRLRNVSSA